MFSEFKVAKLDDKWISFEIINKLGQYFIEIYINKTETETLKHK